MRTTHQLKATRLLLPQVGMVIAALLLLIAAPDSSTAQSTSRDNPTPLKSDELTADFSQDDPEYFYTFTAGPGEVIFTLDVKGAPPGGGIPYFHLFNTEGRQLDSFDQFAAGNASEKLVKRVSFARRQPVVMRIAKPIGSGSYRLRITGAIALEKGAATDGDSLTRLPEGGISIVAPKVGAGGYYALVIGNNAYTSLPKLKTAEADAREVAALLKDFYGFETKLLLNATRSQTVSALYTYRRTLGPEANLLIYYAGHGINDKEADKAYWLPVDAVRDDESTWIIADEITTGIRVIPAKHVLIIADSCYSGTLTRGLSASLPPANAREQFLQRMAAGRSRTLMASGGDEPVADGGGGGNHSVFANALLRGLREIDKDRFTAAELFRYHVEEPVAGRANQTPEYNPLRNSGHESGDFVFVRIKTGGGGRR